MPTSGRGFYAGKQIAEPMDLPAPKAGKVSANTQILPTPTDNSNYVIHGALFSGSAGTEVQLVGTDSVVYFDGQVATGTQCGWPPGDYGIILPQNVGLSINFGTAAMPTSYTVFYQQSGTVVTSN